MNKLKKLKCGKCGELAFSLLALIKDREKLRSISASDTFRRYTDFGITNNNSLKKKLSRKKGKNASK